MEKIGKQTFRKGNKIIKTFLTSDEAHYFDLLYNSFPYHIHSKKEGNKLILPYLESKTLEDAIIKKESSALNIVVDMAEILGNFHFKEYAIVPNYDAVCVERDHFPFKDKFIKSYGYISRIHGDLNPRNILVGKNNQLRFIDRLRKENDTLFDFSFIMSFLCYFDISKDKYYLNLTSNFFDRYLKYVDNVENFLTSFRNNFLNYGYFVFNNRFQLKEHEEWNRGIKVSNDLSKFSSFDKYLTHLKTKV